MTFCDTLIRENMENWLSAAELPFLKEIVNGTLDKKKFVHYLIQDTQYLAGFAKIYAWSFIKTDDLFVMRQLYQDMGLIVAGETESHVDYLKDAGFDPEKIMDYPTTDTCGGYVDYMLDAAKNGTVPEGIFAAGPCNFSYYYLGLELKRRMEELGNYETNYFRPWLEYYVSEEYKACCDHYKGICDYVEKDLSEEDKASIREIFRRCSDYEYEFWAMAYEA